MDSDQRVERGHAHRVRQSPAVHIGDHLGIAAQFYAGRARPKDLFCLLRGEVAACVKVRLRLRDISHRGLVGKHVESLHDRLEVVVGDHPDNRQPVTGHLDALVSGNRLVDERRKILPSLGKRYRRHVQNSSAN